MQGKQRNYNHVAVLMGGVSDERAISIRSGEAAALALASVGYRVMPVVLDTRDVVLPKEIEAVFLALHGEFGEDGGVQSILDQMGIPYTGSGAEASQRGMDKVLTKVAFEAAGIPTPSYRLLKRDDALDRPLPVVVKPVCQGSSIGVHKITSDTQWSSALEEAFTHDDRVMVEDYVEGRELTVSVVGNKTLPVIEIEAPGNWFSFEAKYTQGKTRYICPADLAQELEQEAQQLSLDVFEALGAEGFGRVDFRLNEQGELMVLELNSIPGLTSTSLLPKAAQQAGISFADLCACIMESASPGRQKRCWRDGGDDGNA